MEDKNKACCQRIAGICGKLIYVEDLELIEGVARICLQTERTDDLEPLKMLNIMDALLKRSGGSLEDLESIRRFVKGTVV